MQEIQGKDGEGICSKGPHFRELMVYDWDGSCSPHTSELKFSNNIIITCHTLFHVFLTLILM